MAVLLGGGTGCSSGGPATYPVEGKVVAPGGQPWAGGRVTFQSTSDPGMLATGEIRPDGRFTLTTYYVVAGRARTKPGAVAGEHAVTVEGPESAADRRGAGKPPPVLLPRKYRVEAGENSPVIETPGPPRR
jgi:hypothetical protein